MAEPGRTVRVRGLPTDTDDDRLKDKLYIHFLRKRNGGGEIDSVTIVKATPVSALITFEDSKVAQSVIQHGRHILEVNGKKYNVTVTEHRESLDPDKVIQGLSAMVNHNQLPGGATALTSLQKSHPDIQINYDANADLHTLYGAYSKVQAALAQLLGHAGGPQSAENRVSGQPATSGSTSAQTTQKPHTQESEDESRKPNKQRGQREKVHTGRPFDAGSYRDLTPGGLDWEDTGQTEGAALQLLGHPTTSEEDFILILDADMFQYLQKHCRKEYQHILSQYGVEVVDVTNQGLTTLFLQVATGEGEDGRDQESLRLAKKAISRLYQENETKIRRSQLSKSILSPRGGLQRVMENLSVRFPKLLLNEDDQNVYIIGSSSDVSEAKLFLLDVGDMRDKKEDVASLLRLSSYDEGSSTHAAELRVPLTMSSTVDSVDHRVDQLLRSEEDERRTEGARKFKLAAQFKDSGHGSRPTDFSIRGGLSSPRRQTRPGPMLGHDVLSEPAEIGGERVSRAIPQNTVGDVLFKSGDALPSSAYMQNKTSLNSHLNDTRPKSSPTQPSLAGGSSLPPAGSGSTLKRASSFSGTPQQKATVMGQKSQDDSGKSTVRTRARSSSFSNQTGKDKRDVFSGEITVSIVMWQHIKEAYRSRVDDLTSDVQMKESRSEGRGELTVTVRGANSSKVSSCQQGLQKLVDSVRVDFSVHELRLSELGITDTADENLKACCDEVRSRFKKVTIHVLKKSLYLLGPEQLCSQVAATLREVFSSEFAKMPEQQDFYSPSTLSLNPSTVSQTNGQSVSWHSNPQVMFESQTGKSEGTGSSQERRTNHSGDFGELELMNGSTGQTSLRKDPVFKEKVKIVDAVETDGQTTETFVNHSKTGSDKSARHVNGVGSATAGADKERTIHSTQHDNIQQRQTEIQDTPEESRLGLGGQGGICVCGESDKMLLTRTKCGVTLCSKCLDTVHVHCKVCHKTELTPQGIRGKMSPSKIHIRVPGSKKDSAIKITYLIPDGIQEQPDSFDKNSNLTLQNTGVVGLLLPRLEGHPFPGEPFKGGLFEAYLPDCELSRKLLPRLEKAFKQGLTFTVVDKGKGGKVTWDCIPHKTSLQGGKSGNAYPDSTYLSRLSDVLASHGIEEPPATL